MTVAGRRSLSTCLGAGNNSEPQRRRPLPTNEKAMVVSYRCSRVTAPSLTGLLLSLVVGPADCFVALSRRVHVSRNEYVLQVEQPAGAVSVQRRAVEGDDKRRSPACHASSRQPESESVDRRQALSRAWKAAFSLSAASLALTTAGSPSATAGWLGLPFGDDEAEVEPFAAVPDVSKEISYDDFNRALLRGQVEKCDFYGADLSKAIVHLADGTQALIGDGYPQERAFSDDSPMKVVAVLRNAGVPFTTQFVVKKGYSKGKSYKSEETLQAESRQRAEDETIDRLMAEQER